MFRKWPNFYPFFSASSFIPSFIVPPVNLYAEGCLLISNINRSTKHPDWGCFYLFLCHTSGPGSSVGIATGYGLDGPGIEFRWGRDFQHLSPDRPWGLPSLLYNGQRVFLGGKKLPGRDADPSPSSSVVGHERVELYLYSPYRPYGLCRASVPVQGWPLPLLWRINYVTG